MSKNNPETAARYRQAHRQELAEFNRAWWISKKHPCRECGKLVGTYVTRCKRCSHLGPRSHSWRGGHPKSGNGYVLVWSPDHPKHNKQGYVYEHRLVMEAFLGRPLLPAEVVHHINGIPDDNRTENLERFDSNADHLRHHFIKEG